MDNNQEGQQSEVATTWPHMRVWLLMGLCIILLLSVTVALQWFWLQKSNETTDSATIVEEGATEPSLEDRQAMLDDYVVGMEAETGSTTVEDQALAEQQAVLEAGAWAEWQEAAEPEDEGFDPSWVETSSPSEDDQVSVDQNFSAEQTVE